tara:strand:+ start:35645 stop:36082 length:438 start_codon:yes stop_codon:yes gene_type:complete
MTNKTKENPKKSDSATISKILMTAKAPKLNPKSGGFIHFEIFIINKVLSLKMTVNDGGGLHSKESIAIQKLITLLDEIKSPATHFNSAIFKTLFTSGSANNGSFMASIARELSLIAAVPTKMYSHQLSVNYVESKKKLLALAGKS